MLAPFEQTLWWVPVTIFFAGLLGSPHCMSMCGPLVLNFARETRLLAFYQLGRLCSYVLAGAMVGALGETVLASTQPVWMNSISLITIATLLLLNGYRVFAGESQHFQFPLPWPRFMIKISNSLWQRLRVKSIHPGHSALAAGFLTVLLPCGHLYSFLVGAATTSSPAKGALFMFAFWLGSTPLLSVGSRWFQSVLQKCMGPRHRIAGVLLMIAGLFSVLAFAAKIDFSTNTKEPATSAPLGPVTLPGRCH